MKIVTPLSDAVIRSVKPGDPRKRLSDGDGLYLLPFCNSGSHGWRLDYTFKGVRKTISLGTYPKVSLKTARDLAKKARTDLVMGFDPSALRKREKVEEVMVKEAKRRVAEGLPALGSFEDVARDWFKTRSPSWAPSYSEKVIARLEKDVFPWVGSRPIAEITAPEILAVLRRIESRGVIETAHRTKESCGQVFRFAIAEGKATSDPTRDLKGALRTPLSKNMAAITKPAELARLLRALDGYQGTLIVRTALALAPLLMVRPGELRFATWGEFDLPGATWTIPSARMKRKLQQKLTGKPHVVPLARQAVSLLQELKPLTGASPTGYVFRGEYDHARAMSANTVNAALRRLGYDTKTDMTGHGFRATARTILEEELEMSPAVIEAQLDHSVPDSLGTAYNRTEFMRMRVAMMQEWADYLDGLRRGATELRLAA